jgi:mRNA-degrading endonuclease RelE of RelBE toxin-antitoxin system
MNSLQWVPLAWKQVGKIGDRTLRERIVKGVKSLATFPDCRNIKALTNHQYPYRLRIGDWRVFFSVIAGEITVITIEEVKKR